VPQYRIDVDWEKAGALGVPITSIHRTIAAAFGGAYVNDFIQAGRVKRVYVQGDGGKPQEVRLRLGLTDGNATEVVGGDLAEGAEVIVGNVATGPAPKAASGPRLPF
jgi:multidrug efflux pump subunit AcrB